MKRYAMDGFLQMFFYDPNRQYYRQHPRICLFSYKLISTSYDLFIIISAVSIGVIPMSLKSYSDALDATV